MLSTGEVQLQYNCSRSGRGGVLLLQLCWRGEGQGSFSHAENGLSTAAINAGCGGEGGSTASVMLPETFCRIKRF
jgi:hypothetical protein